jgi:hypothetical protein
VTLVERYDIPCPNGHTTVLLENNLQQITDNLQELDRAAPQITFVCSQCKTAFRFDYLNRKPAGVIDAHLQNPKPLICVVTTRCGKEHCGFPAESVAVRICETSLERCQELFHAEVETWDKTKLLCERHHEGPSAEVLGVRFL